MIDDLNQLFDRLKAELKPRRTIPLHDSEIAVQTVHGFWMVVPTWNLDVALGIIRDGQIEPWTNRVMLEHLKPGDRMVNVGANFGYYAALAAQRVGASGEVHAIEANPVVFPFLVKSSFWCGGPNIIRAYNFAAVDRDSDGKVLTFSFDPQFIGGGNLFSRARENQDYRNNFWTSENVELILDKQRMFIPRGLYSDVETHGQCVDSVVSGPINLMLIDAEGAECYVVDGARNLIDTSPDLTLIMEWDPHSYRPEGARRESIDAMWDFLIEEQGFQICRICPEDYSSLGGLSFLRPIDREQLLTIPHSDLLLRRS